MQISPDLSTFASVPPSRRPRVVAYGSHRLYRTVNGRTRVYELVDAVEFPAGNGRPYTQGVAHQPRAWIFASKLGVGKAEVRARAKSY